MSPADKPPNLDRYIAYIQQVRDGYNKVARAYRGEKDDHQIKLPPYLLFKSQLSDAAKVLELGCASGFPVGKDLLDTGFDYTGIDLSASQIQLAHQQYPESNSHFVESDILSYLENLDDNCIDGIISLFTIFHIPRTRHVDLFTQIKRVLVPGGLVLFTAADGNWEGINEDWFGARMLWSNFSYKFYRVLLEELGYLDQICYRDSGLFQGQEEITYYLLFQNPAI